MRYLAFLYAIFLTVLSITTVGCDQSSIVPATEGVTPDKKITVPVREVTEYLLFESDYPVSYQWYASPDLKRVAYAVTSGDKQFVVVDGIEDEHYDEVKLQRDPFSPDSQHIKYSARSSSEWFGVVDGVKANAGIFSPDSSRIAGIHREGDKMHIVVDGAAGREHTGMDFNYTRYLVFSPDSQRIAFVGVISLEENQKCLAVIDYTPGRIYDDVWEIIFSPDSQHSAYIATWQGERFVVLDGEEGEKYDHVNRLNVVFSPDSQHVAYIAASEGKYFAVIDGVEGKRYDFAQDIVFSPDSQHVAYMADDYLVVDGIEQKAPGGGYDVRFSPDSQRLAYMGCKGGFWGNITGFWVVIDGRKENTYDSVRDVVFSPDSRRVAYVAATEEDNDIYKYFMVVDGMEGKLFDWIEGTPSFSPDSKWVAYAARQGDKAVVVVNGVAGHQYDEIIFPEGGIIYRSKAHLAYQEARIPFDSPNSFYYIAVRGTSVFLVEEHIQ